MKTLTISQLNKELSHLNEQELIFLCLKLAKYKKENKELLTYLLIESTYEEGYIESIKNDIIQLFDTINTSIYHYIKKSVRKILRYIKRYAKYSQKKETEIELLLFFCERLIDLKPSIFDNITLTNIYNRQLISIKKLSNTLHEDLQYDYNCKLEDLAHNFNK